MIQFRRLNYESDFLPVSQDERTIFVYACGYEKRSTHLLAGIPSLQLGREIVPLGFGFRENHIHSWQDNQELLQKLNLTCPEIAANDPEQLLTELDAVLKRETAGGRSIRIVIDYSSMPRVWYCALLQKMVRPIPGVSRCDFWYVRGNFPGEIKYPCVGFGELHVFAGEARVTRTTETHVFGLGFDSTRTYGIWNLLDPQYTCCLIGESDTNRELVDKVKELNHEILLSANVVELVRFDDFPRLVAGIVDLARKCSHEGDVCLIADGPKPLVLAMSMAPLIYGTPGVSSWHVKHVKTNDYIPIDVPPSDDICGFSVIPTVDSVA